MNEILVDATLDKLDEVTSFIEGRLQEAGYKMKLVFAVLTVVEEVFVNIVHYSGSPCAWILCDTDNGAIRLRFRDRGAPYNPLERKDPDITLSAEDREIGGLGILIVKKTMDEVGYEYKDGFNVLTAVKRVTP